MDKLVIVAYVGIKQCYDGSSADYLETISNIFDERIGKNALCLIVPKRDTTEIAIDCINPKLLDAEQYKKVEESVEKLKKAVDSLIKKGED
jgi:malate/lactate dehydrogenase